VVLFVTFGMDRAADGAVGQGRGTDGEAVGPEGMRPAFRGSRTQADGDRRLLYPGERCEKGH